MFDGAEVQRPDAPGCKPSEVLRARHNLRQGKTHVGRGNTRVGHQGRKTAGLVLNQTFLESVRRSVLETWHLVGSATLMLTRGRDQTRACWSPPSTCNY